MSYTPFRIDARADIADLSTKNLPDGFMDLIKEVSHLCGRKGLTQFIKIDARDKNKIATFLIASYFAQKRPALADPIIHICPPGSLPESLLTG